MDIKLMAAPATAEERAAVDALLGAPQSQWEGGERTDPREGHLTYTGAAVRARRHLLLPALQAVQQSVGWVSEGAMDYVCERLNVPPADAWGVATFYALLATSPRPRQVLHVCDDIACKARGAERICAVLEREAGPAHSHAPEGDHVDLTGFKPAWMRSPCLGLCDRAPAAFVQATTGNAELLDFSEAEARAFIHGRFTPSQAPVKPLVAVGGRLLNPNHGDALEKALAMGAQAVIKEVTDSRLMGRGGAAFPTGRKWAAVASQPVTERFLICNADESEPGTFKDRVLLDRYPGEIVEAMTIAAFATGCRHGFLYIRGEYPTPTQRFSEALARARERPSRCQHPRQRVQLRHRDPPRCRRLHLR
jgi:NADH-quinone oxidoreductase subunit F